MAKRNKSVDPGRIGVSTFDDRAQVQKNSDGGLSWKPLGAAGSAVRVGLHTPVMCFNSAGAIGFVTFGGASVSAPTGGSDGMPVKAGDIAFYNSGENEYIVASAATIFVYTADPELNQ